MKTCRCCGKLVAPLDGFEEKADKCYCQHYEKHFGACGSKWCFCHQVKVAR